MAVPHFQDKLTRIYQGDARDMADIPDASAQCVVTSPPYWGLRLYSGLPDLVWGGSRDCDHQWGDIIPNPMHRSGKHGPASVLTKTAVVQHEIRVKGNQGAFCKRCGAWMGSFGLEPTVEMYIEHTLEILQEVRRVLRKDGVVFWNIGDSYAGSGGYHTDGQRSDSSFQEQGSGRFKRGQPIPTGGLLKPKDLSLVPFRVAIAAQEAGWWVRSVIIWSKINPMPESVTDRPTNTHEYILMMTLSGRPSFWTHRDGGGTRVRPRANYRWVNQATQEEVDTPPAGWKTMIGCPDCGGSGQIKREVWFDFFLDERCSQCNGRGKIQQWKRINLWKGHDYYWDADAVREPHLQSAIQRASYPMNPYGDQATGSGARLVGSLKGDGSRKMIHLNPLGKNIQSVWEFATPGYHGAHFAVFPDRLPEICIKAATPEEGCCSKCGAPWVRVLEKVPSKFNMRVRGAMKGSATPVEGFVASEAEIENYRQYGNHPPMGSQKTIGWQPTCDCGASKIPSLVLDPFLGSGTTLLIAKKLLRRAVGYELSRHYCDMALDRIRQEVLGI